MPTASQTPKRRPPKPNAPTAPTTGQPLGAGGAVAPDAREVRSLLHRIGEEYDSLSQVLQRIARYVEGFSDQMALQRVQDVARHAQVQPSAVIRFAKHFGFSGYSAMREVFRADMSAQINQNKNYQSRIRELVAHSDHRLSGTEISQSYIGGAIAGMQALQQALGQSTAIDEAVDLLAQASGVWVAGTNRAFPVASYLVYALQHTDKPVHWVAGIGAMYVAELRALRQADVLIAISFAPYGKETLAAVETAHQQGAKVLALTDTHLSPLAKRAHVSLVIPESSVFGFRSLTNTMVMAQSLFVALAYRLELQGR